MDDCIICLDDQSRETFPMYLRRRNPESYRHLLETLKQDLGYQTNESELSGKPKCFSLLCRWTTRDEISWVATFPEHKTELNDTSH